MCVIGVLLWATEQELSRETEILVAVAFGLFNYMIFYFELSCYSLLSFVLTVSTYNNNTYIRVFLEMQEPETDVVIFLTFLA
jgi:hypothetical protein